MALSVPKLIRTHHDLDAHERRIVAKDPVGFVTAIHEAGHIVACLALEGRFVDAELVYKNGKCDSGAVYGANIPYGDDCYLYYLASGYATERAFCGNLVSEASSIKSAQLDLEHARKVLGTDPMSSIDYLGLIFSAQGFMKRRTDPIRCVAFELWDRWPDAETLKESEAIELYKFGVRLP